MGETTELHVNGAKCRVETDPARSLLSVLRDDLDLTGAKYGCGEGRCGACTVTLDGKAIRSCRTKLGDCAGKEVATVESLEHDGKLHPLQAAFLDADAMQCGYCTAGMIMASVALLDRTPNPTGDDVRRGLEGNVCRCGTYQRILAAVLKAAKNMKGGDK